MQALLDVAEQIYREHFNIIKLYQNKYIDDYCPESYTDDFIQCFAPLDNLWISRNIDAEKRMPSDSQPLYKAPLLLDESSIITRNVTMIPSFLGRIFLVKNVCLSPHGQIFSDHFNTNSTYVGRYMTGKMYDDDDVNKSTISVVSDQDNPVFNMIDVNISRAMLLVIPHSENFGHEFLDLYPQLFMLNDILMRNPEIHVLVHAPLSAKKMFPILHAMNIYPEKLNYFTWNINDRQSFYCMDEVITTTSSYSNHVNTKYVAAFREAVKRLDFYDSTFNVQGEGILFSDRRDQPGRRNLLEGEEIVAALERKYASPFLAPGTTYRPIKLFIGNESLEETVRLFRSSRIFISVHGAQMSNMVFMHPGSIVIEIQPYEFQNVDVFLNLAPALGVKPFRYISKSGAHWTHTSVESNHFLNQVMGVIDSLQ